MIKTLVTHINPHLDDIAAIWLFKRFNPDFKDSDIQFLTATKNGVTFEDKPVDSDPNVVHFGIGRGRFDEHKGDIDECATSLVWKEVLANKSFEQEVQKAALDRLVEWVRLEDTGRLPLGEFAEFSVPAFIRPKDSTQGGSKKALELGAEILDRILQVLIKREQANIDWKNHVQFESPFGRSFAVQSDSVDRVFCKEQGGDLFLMYSPSNGFVQVFTPSMEIDLEPIFNKLKQLDPEASWFLHHSHHMVLCGSGSAPDSKKTKLSFKQLIEAIK